MITITRGVLSGILCVAVFGASLAAQDARSGVLSPDAVAEQVRARFAPSFAGNRAAVLDPGETCLTPLVARLREVASDLSPDVRAALARLDPNLALAIDHGLSDAGHALGSALPDYPDLDLVEEGTSCIVHYTLSGEHAVASAQHVVLVRKVLDLAAKKMGKVFRAPFAENGGGAETRLHVYVAKIPDDDVLGPVNGFVAGVNDVPDVSGKPRSVYMVLSNTLVKPEDTPKEWKARVKATCVHEFMHCVQYAYNHALSRWALEGQAVWSENRVAKVTAGQLAFLDGAGSILREPEKALWTETIRMYSTSPLFHYADLVFGKDAPVRILEAALAQDDALLVLQSLANAEGLAWDDFYKSFLARLYYKDIPRIPAKKFPEMTLADAPVDTFGWTGSGEIAVTGFRVHVFDPPGGYPTSLLFARVAKFGAMTGSPSGVVLHDKNKRLAIGTGSWDHVEGFAGKREAVLIVTDTAYVQPTATMSPYAAEVFAPHIRVTSIDAESPVAAGSTSTITFTYDLLGTPAGLSDVPVVLHVERKGPCCPVNAPTFPTWPAGAGQQATYTFFAPSGPGAVGTYKFRFYAKVPNDVYGGGHVRSIGQAKVKVLSP